MTKKGIERNIIVFLFVLILVIFSFAERDSRKLERLYTTAQLLKASSKIITDVAAELPAPKSHNN